MTFISRAVPRNNLWENPEAINLFKSTYSIHQAVWSLFLGDTEKKRDYIYRCDQMNGYPVIIIVSKERPVDVHGLWVVETKEYNPQIHDGMLLGFTVRVNPVVTRSGVDEKTGKPFHKRHDVVMDCKYQSRKEGKPFLYDSAIQSCGISWLTQREELNGFKVIRESVRVDGYQKHEIQKSSGKDTVTISTLDIQGVIKVTDSKMFIDMLMSGLGPAKGFGCGLMLVRKING